MVERVRVAVAGLGAVARAVYLPILTRRSDRFEIVGLCDLSGEAADAMGERFSVAPAQRFTALEKMLDTVEPDALAVLTSGSHTEAALAGLDRGIAVLCEKPLAMTVREADLLDRAVGGREDRLMLGYMKVYDPAVRRAAELVEGRSPARAVDVTVLHPSGEAQLAMSELGPGAFELPTDLRIDLEEAQKALEAEALGEAAAAALGGLYSGVLLGSVVHDLAVLRTLGVELTAIDHADRWPHESVPASVSFAARTAEGVRVNVAWHYLDAYPAYREQVRWHDQHGSVELEFPSPYLLRAPTTLRTLTSTGEGASEKRFASHVEAFEEQLLAFHAMVTDGVVPAAGVDEGRADVVTCQRVAAALARREGLELGGEAATMP
ncbi:MAG: Gfo/Idh/MocA family protein [Egibacteraceae bacterium]